MQTLYAKKGRPQNVGRRRRRGAGVVLLTADRRRLSGDQPPLALHLNELTKTVVTFHSPAQFGGLAPSRSLFRVEATDATVQLLPICLNGIAGREGSSLETLFVLTVLFYNLPGLRPKI